MSKSILARFATSLLAASLAVASLACSAQVEDPGSVESSSEALSSKCAPPPFEACVDYGAQAWSTNALEAALQEIGCDAPHSVLPANDTSGSSHDWQLLVCPRSSCSKLESTIAPYLNTVWQPQVVESCIAPEGALSVAYFSGDSRAPTCPTCSVTREVF